MKEKKALFVATVGGFVTQFEMNNVSLLQKAGYEVHSAANFHDPVYCVKEQELMEKGLILHQVDMAKSPFMWRENLGALRQLCRIVKTEKITLLHCHTPVGGLLGRMAGVLCGGRKLKVIYTAHGFHFYRGAPWRNWIFYYHVEKFLACCTDILITINEEDYARACGFKLRRGGRVYKIPGEGLHNNAALPLTENGRKKLRVKLGIPEDAFFILSVGELNGNKNHGQIIRLIPLIQERLWDRRIFYGICGDGYYREELQELIEQTGLRECVKLFGYRTDIQDFLACADCFLFPSVREGLGMAALEALAQGVPAAVSDNRGTREYMKDGRNGLVCDVKKPESFVNALEKICHMSAEERSSMCMEAKETAKRFELSHTEAVMTQVYAALNEEAAPVDKLPREIRCISLRKGSVKKGSKAGRSGFAKNY